MMMDATLPIHVLNSEIAVSIQMHSLTFSGVSEVRVTVGQLSKKAAGTLKLFSSVLSLSF